MLSWKGKWALRAQVLSQLNTHKKSARLDPFVLDGRQIELYGWRQPNDLYELQSTLGVPAALLSIGLELFQGFPEDDRGTKEHIEAVQSFLEAVPVGRDLSDVVPSFIAWRFTDEQWSIPSQNEKLTELLERVALMMLDKDKSQALENEIEAEQNFWTSEIRRQWKTDGRVAAVVYENLEVLKVAQAACRLDREPSWGSAVAYNLTNSLTVTNTRGRLTKKATGGLLMLEAMQQKLLFLMAGE